MFSGGVTRRQFKKEENALTFLLIAKGQFCLKGLYGEPHVTFCFLYEGIMYIVLPITKS